MNNLPQELRERESGRAAESESGQLKWTTSTLDESLSSAHLVQSATLLALPFQQNDKPSKQARESAEWESGRAREGGRGAA